MKLPTGFWHIMAFCTGIALLIGAIMTFIDWVLRQ